MSGDLLNQRLAMLADLLTEFHDRVIIEDGWGWQYDLRRARTIGTATDDPGVVLHIEQAARHPDA